MQGGERYNSVSNYLKSELGSKTIKLSIDAGFTCPNRDGKKSFGGCAFCSSGGSGELASSGDIQKAIDEQILINSKKWPDAKYLAYFQAHTNTYAPVEILREKYMSALNDPRISGIVIATRPDCLEDEVIDLLDEINKKYFMWIELGFQTSKKESRDAMGIACSLEEYDIAVEKLLSKGIKIVSHIILGLPGESTDDMLNSVKYICKKPIFGIKLHLLNIVKGSRLALTQPEYVSFTSIDEYVDLVIKCLEIIPANITIHRLTGDVPRNLLISPEWSYLKRTILNRINYQLKEKNSYQGKRCQN